MREGEPEGDNERVSAVGYDEKELREGSLPRNRI